jgi:NTP pyrophosphatase (non-canonical NTP hydrolase)
VADQIDSSTTIEMLLAMLAKDSHTDSLRWFPDTAFDLGHHALALCGEVGEVANVVKKLQRGSLEEGEARDLLKSELADVFIYLLNCTAILKINLGLAYIDKQRFNQERF